MFWAGPDPVETIRQVKATGVRCGQLGIPPDMQLAGAAPPGTAALEVGGVHRGDRLRRLRRARATPTSPPSSARWASSRRPPAPSAKRERCDDQRLRRRAGRRRASPATSVSCRRTPPHPDYIAVREMVRRVADHAAPQPSDLRAGDRAGAGARAVELPRGRGPAEPVHQLRSRQHDPLRHRRSRSKRSACWRPTWSRSTARTATGRSSPGALGRGAAARRGLGGHRALHRQAEGDRLPGHAEHRARGRRPDQKWRDIADAVALPQATSWSLYWSWYSFQ